MCLTTNQPRTVSFRTDALAANSVASHCASIHWSQSADQYSGGRTFTEQQQDTNTAAKRIVAQRCSCRPSQPHGRRRLSGIVARFLSALHRRRCPAATGAQHMYNCHTAESVRDVNPIWPTMLVLRADRSPLDWCLHRPQRLQRRFCWRFWRASASLIPSFVYVV